jgi:hypothetical protein
MKETRLCNHVEFSFIKLSLDLPYQFELLFYDRFSIGDVAPSPPNHRNLLMPPPSITYTSWKTLLHKERKPNNLIIENILANIKQPRTSSI